MFIDEVYKILMAVGLSTSNKADFATYQLKDVAKVWYVQYRQLRAFPLTWEIFKKTFLDRFFPRKMRESKVVEFINLLKGGISVHEYH